MSQSMISTSRVRLVVFHLAMENVVIELFEKGYESGNAVETSGLPWL